MKERRRCPDNPYNTAIAKATGGAGTNGLSTRAMLDVMNAAASESYNTGMLSACRYCGRTFLPEKLAIHNRSCTADNPARRVTDSVNRTPQALAAQVVMMTAAPQRRGSASAKASGSTAQWTDAYDTAEAAGASMVSCNECGRQFNNVAYAKHTKVCRTSSKKTRKVFDSAKQRALGTDLMAYYNSNKRQGGSTLSSSAVSRTQSGMKPVSGGGLRGMVDGGGSHSSAYGIGGGAGRGGRGGAGGGGGVGGMPKWKYDSLSFRAAMRAARQQSRAEASESSWSGGGGGSSRGGSSGGGGSGWGGSGGGGSGAFGGRSRGAGGGAGARAGAYAASSYATSHARGMGMRQQVQQQRQPPEPRTSNGDRSRPPRQPAHDPALEAFELMGAATRYADPSYVQCPTCGRSFSEKAAERHIPKCENIIAKPLFLSKNSGAPSHSTRQPARTAGSNNRW